MVALFAPTVLLFTSAVMAQAQTPSVVTSQSVGPVPTTEGVFTIQTSVPGLSTSACYEVCFQAPCAPCGVTSEGSMGIPAGETPIPNPLRSSEGVVSSGAPLLSSSTGLAGTLSRGSAALPSVSGSAPAQQSTSAASVSIALGHGTTFKIALAVSSLALVGASLVF